MSLQNKVVYGYNNMINPRRLTLHFANDAEEAPRVARRVEDFLKKQKVPASLINKTLLCVDELITNIIAHAYTDHEEHAVLLECCLSDTALTLELRDDGVPFDPTKQTRPNLNLSLESRNIGGLGIHLVMTLMDKVEYYREGVFNVLKMEKLINS